VQEILDWIHKQGYSPVEQIKCDGQVHRFTHRGHKRDNIGYCFYEHGGWMHDHTIGKTFNWNPKRVLTDPLAQKKIKQQQEKIKKEIDAQKKEAIKEAAKLWEEGVEPVNHPYLERKNIKPYGIKQKGNLLLIPVQNGSGLSSLQTIDDEGDKLFLRGGEVKGRYHLLANDGENLSTIIICEGYATAASIREATGYPVVAAFFASNLPLVAKHFKKEYPDSRIIIAADNDKHNEVNAGVVAANKCDGCEIRPVQFKDGENGTDYNDLAMQFGLPAIQDQLFPLPVAVDDKYQDKDFTPKVIGTQPFRILGCNKGVYYYYPESTQQIIELSAMGHTPANLLQLAPLRHWVDLRMKHEEIVDDLMQKAHKKGIFKPEEQIRGRGIWLDGEDIIFNSGEKLYIHGINPISLNEYKTDNIYVRAKAIPAPLEPLTNAEAYKLREICEMGTWKNPVAGLLLAGWLVVSLACGTLKWRPHIWITGASSSGKTTFLKDIIGRTLGSLKLSVEGGTTEPALRQSLGDDNRPIVYDEAESESKRQQEAMEGTLELARKASSGAAVIKGSPHGEATTYYCRSTFCFSGINAAIRHFADETRISMLELRKVTDKDEDYKRFKAAFSETLTQNYHQRLMGRVITYLPVLLKNCDIFVDACTEVLRDRRAADQVGTMLAGLYLLHSTNVIAYDDAVKFIKTHDVRSFTAVDELTDSERLLSFICSQKLRYERYEEQIGSLIKKCYTPVDKTTGMHKDTALDLLRGIGIWPKPEGMVLFANNSPPLAHMLKDTPWTKWVRSLSDLAGTETVTKRTYSAGIAPCRGIAVPKEYFLKGEDDD